jgi:cytochrome P450
LPNENATTLSLSQIHQPEYTANPYLLYRQLREADPVFWDEGIQAWVLTGYNDIVTALRDPRFSAQRFMPEAEWLTDEVRAMLGSPMRALERQMLFLDPPDHTRLRSLVSKAFTPRVIEGLRSYIQRIVDQLLDNVQDKGRMDMTSDFAFPLPAIVISQMLGVPPEDREQFMRWTEAFGRVLDGGDLTPETGINAFLGVSEFMDYFRKIVEQRQTQPKDDLIQALITAEEGGTVLSEEELLGNCVLLLAAGHGTTTHLIGNGMLALLRNPDQWHLLQEQPALVPAAVMELLRYDGPVQATSREAKEDLVLHGKQIHAGQSVIMSLGAASRDPAMFDDPDRLDIRRKENRHLAFGHGIHFCLGAPLARLEAEIAFGTLARRLHNPRIEDESRVRFFPSLVFRGLEELPITFDS